MQAKLQQIGTSIRRRAYLPERMFPRLREQIGTALDLIVEFSTLGEYRLVVDAPGGASAPVEAPSQAPQMGGVGARAPRAAVRQTVAGGAAGRVPVATPAARRLTERQRSRGGSTGGCVENLSPCDRNTTRLSPSLPEQLCLAV